MTKRKLVLISHRKMWEPVIAQLIDGLLREPPRTDGKGQRAKIRLRLHKDFKHVVKWPKCVLVESDNPDYIIREYRNCTLLDHLYDLTISQWNTSMIYKRRQGILLSMSNLERSLDIDVEDV